MNILNPNFLLKDSVPEISKNEEFQRFIQLAKLAPYIHFDTESNGRNYKDGSGHTIGISIDYSIDEGRSGYSYYFPFRHQYGNLPQNYLGPIKELLEDPSKTLVAQNFRHDHRALRSLGISPGDNWLCTMQIAHDVDENKLSYQLDYLTKQLGYAGKARDDHFESIKKLLGWDGIPPDLMQEYAATDASLLRPLIQHYEPVWHSEDETGGVRWRNDQKFMLLMNKIEETGIKVDLDLAEKKVESGERRLQEIRDELHLNPGSNKDLEKLLIEDLNLPVVKRSEKTDKPSFDKFAMAKYEEYLVKMNSPVARLVLEYRGYQKAVSSYWRAYLNHVSADGRIRPNFNLHRTVTSRLSCDTPNTQQIPKITEKPWHGDVKLGFIPESGFALWEADYSQLEMRLSAAYSGERDLIEIFNDPDRDIFTEMAEKLGMPRPDTKTLNYAIQYGSGITHLSDVFGISREAATVIRNDYYSAWPGFAEKSKIANTLAQRRGYVKTWSGRRRHFVNPREEGHKAYNAIIQGGAADIVKRRMLALDEQLDPECRMLLQIHDSVVFEMPIGSEKKYGPQIIEIMEDVHPDFGVKFKVDFHKWGS